MTTFSDDTFAPKPSLNERPVRKFESYAYPLLKKGERVFEVTSFKEDVETDERWWKEGEPVVERNGKRGVLRLVVNLRLLVPGAENATTDAQRKKVMDSGHGAFFQLKFKPVVSGPRKAKNGDTLSPSGLYTFLSTIFFDGQPIPDVALGIGAPDAEVKAYMIEHNSATERQITLPEARRMITGYKVNQMINSLIEDATNRTLQLRATLGLNKAGDRNRVTEVLGRVEAEELLPTFKPYPKPADPREAGDNPEVVCTIDGTPLRGFEWHDGTWVSNSDWAAKQHEMFGPWKYTFGGKKYAPPFGPNHYRSAKNAFLAQKNTQAAVPTTDEDEELPF